MVHPREGWQGHGVPRRRFLKGGVGLSALAALGAGGALTGCASDLTGSGTLPLPRPNNPVQWPIFAGNTAIKPGLAPERDATLQVFIWTAYINQACVNAFAKKYKCKVQLTTFDTMDEALSKLRSGLSYDLLIGATPDIMGQLVEGQLVQPLNHSYIPNIAQAWPDYTDPFYDKKWQYTVPYTIYTTGISWRKDLVHENPYAMANPWTMPWQPKYRGRVAILDDYREGICLGLMKNGIFNLNTTDYQQIALARQSLQELSGLVNLDHQQQRLLRRPRRPDLDHQRLVGRHGRRRVVHAQGRQRRRGRLLGPDRRPLPGQQRHDGGAEVGRPARCSPTCSSTTCSTCRTRSRTSPGTATCSRSTG